MLPGRRSGGSGLGEIPFLALIAAVVPFILGLIVGAVDREWTQVLDDVPNITIPFMSFAVGTGISLGTVLTGGLQGVFLGVGVVAFTGGLTYLGYRYVLKRVRRAASALPRAPPPAMPSPSPWPWPPQILASCLMWNRLPRKRRLRFWSPPPWHRSSCHGSSSNPVGSPCTTRCPTPRPDAKAWIDAGAIACVCTDEMPGMDRLLRSRPDRCQGNFMSRSRLLPLTGLLRVRHRKCAP